MFGCRLKPIPLSLALEKKYLVKNRFNSFHNNQLIFKKGIEAKAIVNEHQPFTAAEMQEKNARFTTSSLELEIACGMGDFLIEIARKFKGNFFVGVDWSLACLQRAVKKAQDYNLDNVLFYHGDAYDFLKYDFKDFNFTKIMINFPDPWPKKKHWKRRIINLNFLKLLSTKLTATGKLITATDVYPLFLYHNSLIKESENFLQSKTQNNYNNYNAIPHPYYAEASKYQKKNLSGSNKVFYTLHQNK